eukprot:tig00021105_g18240.t1
MAAFVVPVPAGAHLTRAPSTSSRACAAHSRTRPSAASRSFLTGADRQSSGLPVFEGLAAARQMIRAARLPLARAGPSTIVCSAEKQTPAESRNAFDAFANAVKGVFDSSEAFRKGFMAASVAALLFASSVDPAMAASGGRVGGSNFNSSRQQSAPSRSYSAPSYSQPYIAPAPYVPYGYGFSPFGWGFGWGFGPSIGFGLPIGGIFSIFLFMAVASFLLRAGSRVVGGTGLLDDEYEMAPTLTVAELQVGLLATAGRTLQADLERLARDADTSTASGLQSVLQETCLSLLRHPEYIVYAGGKSKTLSLNDAETEFNRMSVSERGKFDDETLSNVRGRQNSKKEVVRLSKDVGEYIVVTLLVAAEGDIRDTLPKQVRSREDLIAALRGLGSVPSNSLSAVEVLWTPQQEGDVLTAEQFLTDYPDLRML